MEQPEVRVGDAERRVVDDRLMAAVGDGVLTLIEYDERAGRLWESRTRSELQALVADLPPTSTGPLEVARTARDLGDRGVVASSTPLPVQGRRVVGRQLLQRVRSLGLAGVLLLGAAAVVASGTDQRVVFGSGTVQVLDQQEEVRVSLLFGSVEVVVPDDAEVQLDGLVVFGSTECAEACDGDGTGQVVRLRSLGGFGSVEVVTRSELANRPGAGAGGP